MRILIRLTSTLIFVTLVVSISAQTGGQGSWSSKAAMEHAADRDRRRLRRRQAYVIGGGLAMAESSTVVQEYDPKTDRWRDRAPLPMALSHAGVAALNGRCMSSADFSRTCTSTRSPYSFEYDPAKNSWRTLPWMKAARGSVGVVALGGKIHAIGGRGIDRITVGTHEIYDPATNQWTGRQPLPQARDHAPTVVADGKIRRAWRPLRRDGR